MSHFFEGGFCPVEEYRAYEEARIREDELVVASLYTIMFLLKGQQQASKFPSRINEIKQSSSGSSSVVRYSIINDSGPEVRALGVFCNGLWQRKGSTGIEVEGVPIINGYFREYSPEMDDMDRELQEMLRQSVKLEAPKELTAA